MKRSKTIGITVLFMILLLGAGGIFLMRSIVNKAIHLKIHSVNLSNLTNGVYEGAYAIDPVQVALKVIITNHRITDIQIIKHQNGLGSDAEAIVKSIIAQQTLKVDTVSGATVSSQCILKAVEISLTEEEK